MKLGRTLSEGGDEVFCLVGVVMEMKKSGLMQVWWTPAVGMGFRGRSVWRWFDSSLRVCPWYGLLILLESCILRSGCCRFQMRREWWLG